jgi:crotonobetainyl-CoA:carnitine CoA-transferase CaiB-like acyl-CoA transferase
MQGKPWEETRECNPWFHAVNRGKLGVTLNFTTERGAALIRQLLRQSDIVVDNFTPGVLHKHHLPYDALTAVKPDLIMVSISVAGQHGPYCDTRAYAFNLHALSGLCSFIDYTGDTVPRHIDIAYADWNAGMFATYAILLALYHRRRTSEGQYIDLSAWEATTTLLTEGILDYTLNQRVAGPQDNHHPAMAPHGYYPCQGEDVWLALAVRSEPEWSVLCTLMAQPALAHDPRFGNMYQRLRHRDELDQHIAAWTTAQDVEQLAKPCRRAVSLPCRYAPSKDASTTSTCAFVKHIRRSTIPMWGENCCTLSPGT